MPSAQFNRYFQSAPCLLMRPISLHLSQALIPKRLREPSVAVPGILCPMAKVMVSLPDDVLRAVDAEASHRGTSRSGYLRELAEEAMRQRGRERAARMAEIDRLDGPLP